MAQDLKCEICGRSARKGIIKGESFHSPKCPLYKKNYPSRGRGRHPKGAMSEYGKELIEKQIVKMLYRISERQVKNYVKEALKKRGLVEDASLELIKKLEKRLDNVVYRLGFATSRAQARQLVSHKHFLVNGKPMNIPSYQVKVGDIISVKENKKNRTFYKRISLILKNYQPPSWLALDKAKLEGKVIGEPTAEEASIPAEISSIFEFYSK
jgi:small subunit ribosomal protein S4